MTRTERGRRLSETRYAEVMAAVEWGRTIGLDWGRIASDAGYAHVDGLAQYLRRHGCRTYATAIERWRHERNATERELTHA